MEEDFLKQHNLDELIDYMFYPTIEIHKETLIDFLKDYKKQLILHGVVSTCCDNCNTESKETITFCKDCYLKDSEQ